MPGVTPTLPQTMRPLPLACGLTISIQASELYLCSPRDGTGPYYRWQVEFGRPDGSTVEPSDDVFSLLKKYAEGPPEGGVYGFVPTSTILRVIKLCGGAAPYASKQHPFVVQHRGLGCCKTRYYVHAEQRRALAAPERASARME